MLSDISLDRFGQKTSYPTIELRTAMLDRIAQQYWMTITDVGSKMHSHIGRRRTAFCTNTQSREQQRTANKSRGNHRLTPIKRLALFLSKPSWKPRGTNLHVRHWAKRANDLRDAEVHNEKHEDNHGRQKGHVGHTSPVTIVEAQRNHLRFF